MRRSVAWAYGVGVVVIALVCGVGVYAALRAIDGCPDAYASTATIRVEVLPYGYDGTLVEYGDPTKVPSHLTQSDRLVSSGEFLGELVKALRSPSGSLASELDEEELRDRLEARATGDGFDVEIRAVDTDAGLARTLAEAASESFARFYPEAEPARVTAAVVQPATYSKDRVPTPAYLCD